MVEILKRIRGAILFTSIIFSVGVFFLIKKMIPDGSTQIIKYNEVLGLTSAFTLYLTLLISPLFYAFPALPLKVIAVKARRALGVSAFYFAFLHGTSTFFFQLQGFEGVGFLSNRYLFALGISEISLGILFILTLTSFDSVIHKLGKKKWKFIHRFIYIASGLILLHVLLLGTHFSSLKGTIPRISFTALIFLCILEAERCDGFLEKYLPANARLKLSTIVTAGVSSVLIFLCFSPQTEPSLNIHAQHIQIAKDAQSDATKTYAGLTGDRTKRFTVSFLHSDAVLPNTDTTLQFQVYDASSGNPVQLFTPLYSKLLHLIIVDEELQYFHHIHPVLNETGFQISTQFPKAGNYHVYLNFQPIGAIEQQFGFTIHVGGPTPPVTAMTPEDLNMTKHFDTYDVTLQKPNQLRASELSIGGQTITFHLEDAQTHEPIKNLQPYLAAFGHLTLINEKTYDFLHVHPSDPLPPGISDVSGPDVKFLPLGIYGPIKPGIYRAFAEFNPGGKVLTTNFTVKVE